ncbi:MAG: glycosyltransferase family 4 protein [Moorellales bacterium]
MLPLPARGSLGAAARSASLDVLFVVWWEQLPELVKAGVPVVYWEKGHEALYGEVGDLSPGAPLRRWMAQCYREPCHLVSVSPTEARILRVRFGRASCVVPNGIDTAPYSPGRRPNDGTVLLIGNPFLRFKGFEVALRALQRAWDFGARFKVKWICQVRPQVQGTSFPLSFVVNPPQAELPQHIASSDLLLFTSWYESFGNPPLEAMACGVPVVATDCGGIQAYAQAGENALLADPGDVDSLAHAVIYLLGDAGAREYLARRGRETALRFHWTNTVRALESCLYAAATGHYGGAG